MNRDFLQKIVEHKRGLLDNKRAFFAAFKKKVKGSRLRRYHIFKKAIARRGKINLIAEIKKASPSAGLVRADFDLISIAKAYVEAGAAALSVLTEEKYFLGKPHYIKRVTEEFKLPVLTKDFIIDEVQIYEAYANGASAVLLIVAILQDEELKHLMQVAGELDMDCLVEVHEENDLARALRSRAQIIGINNRDLKTLKVDLKACERLIPKVPKGKVIVAESGIRSHADVLKLKALGAHAVLIGETFMKAPDIGAKVRELMFGRSDT